MPHVLRSSRAGFAALAVALITAASSARPDIPTDAELIASVDAIVSKALSNPGAVGLSIAIARDGKVILAKGYGMAELEHQIPATATTMFRIGSVTKQYTAAAIMRLAEQGKLSLDNELGTYFPDYPTQGHTVTVRHLLNHTSGIKSYTQIEEIMQKHIAYDMSVDELLSWVKDIPFDFAPGEQYAYNNTAYYMLGSIIEQASGTPYCQYLQDEFFTPMGLLHTRCDSNADIIPGRAQGYGMRDGELVNDRLIGMDNPGAAGMLIASAADLVRWNMALMNGEVVSAESLKLMTTPTILPDGTNTNYGFGLMMNDLEGHRRISHGGGIFGFNSTLVHYPDDDLYVAVIANGGSSAGRLGEEISRAALDIELNIADLTPSADEIARFTGHYVIQNIELAARIFEKDGFVYLQATDQPAIRLLYQGRGEFRASFDPNVKVVFDAESTEPKADRFILFQGGAQLPGIRQADDAPPPPPAPDSPPAPGSPPAGD